MNNNKEKKSNNISNNNYNKWNPQLTVAIITHNN